MGVPPVEPWQNEHRIDVLLDNPAVRFRIEQASQSASWYEQLMNRSPIAMATGSVAIPGMQIAGIGALVGLGVGMAAQS